MPRTEQQLESWAKRGPMGKTSDTYQKLRKILKEDKPPRLANRSYEVYRQGSYNNDTHIRADGDVDVVVEMRSTLRYDDSGLDPFGVAALQKWISPATDSWEDFRRDVILTLQDHYGTAAIQPDKKCIKVTGTAADVPADVVVAQLYRKFGKNFSDHQDGITFLALPEGRRIINYPEQHYQNGVAKHRQSNEWYKHVVRMFKNARNRLVEQGRTTKKDAPSYFIECLIYNVPNNRFVASTYLQAYKNTLVYLAEANLNSFMCQNGLMPLFGNTPEQWSTAKATEFILNANSLI